MSETRIAVDIGLLRRAIQDEYVVVAEDPSHGFHFHTGRHLAGPVGYKDEWLDGIAQSAVESFAGTGNPFSLGAIKPGEYVIDVGCGAGIDSLIAAKLAGRGKWPWRDRGDWQFLRMTLPAGWRWTTDVKPIAGTDPCQATHVGTMLNGRMCVRHIPLWLGQMLGFLISDLEGRRSLSPRRPPGRQVRPIAICPYQ